MDQQEENRQCPICEQISTDNEGDLRVAIFPSRKILVHEGCVNKIVKVWVDKVVEPKYPKIAKILRKLI